MSAKAYAAEITRLIERLEHGLARSIVLAAEAVAASLRDGHRIWLPSRPTACTRRRPAAPGGFIAVHILRDAAMVQPGDCVLIGSPVGTSEKPITFTQECQMRGARVIALTNVEFEDDPRTLLDNPQRKRLHEVADIVIDVPGPLGDGVFEVEELQLRAIPHSGVTGMTAMWMVFSEALAILRAAGVMPRLYECVNVEGARAKNAVLISGYLESAVGVLAEGEAAAAVAAAG